MTTALVTHPDGLKHVAPPGFPERVERLEAVLAALEGLDLARQEAPLASDDDILALHDPAYVAHVKASVPERGFAGLDAKTDAETFLCPTSLPAVWRAVGGALAAVDLVMSGEAANAFVAMRPPGHHALSDEAMGFCIFGNVALAAHHALKAHGLARVAIVDFDVHHGNGTQALLWDEPRTLFFSSHQMPLWPGSGHPSERGAHDNVVNVPLAPHTGGAEMRAAYEAHVLPRLEAFAPELILVSAGFDAHRADPLAQLNWEAEDYAWLTERICTVAAESCKGRVVSCLEGGYDLGGLAASARAHVEALREAAS